VTRKHRRPGRAGPARRRHARAVQFKMIVRVTVCTDSGGSARPVRLWAESVSEAHWLRHGRAVTGPAAGATVLRCQHGDSRRHRRSPSDAGGSEYPGERAHRAGPGPDRRTMAVIILTAVGLIIRHGDSADQAGTIMIIMV
jgi:hypothetical protein